MASNMVDRRLYKRHAIACPSRVALTENDDGAKCKAVNVSDGGMLLTIPVLDLPARDATIKVRFAIPRRTPNTYMLEEFTCRARVLRHQPLKDDRLAAVAVRFENPLQLAMEV